MKKLYTISEVSKKLNLIKPKSKKPLNHVLRFWEKEFKQIQPKKINNRRYYTESHLQKLKIINFLLKNRGMTILGVKKILNDNVNKLDANDVHSLQADYYRINLKNKSKKLLDRLKEFKKHGKKNSS